MPSLSTKERLKERIKELVCLYETTHIINQKNITIEEVLTNIGQNLEKALKYSDDAIVEIVFKDLKILTNVLPQKTVCIDSKTFIENNEVGFIKIHYPISRVSIFCSIFQYYYF